MTLLQTITDDQAQSITGGGQLVTNSYSQTFTFEQQTVLDGYSNAGGQFKTKASGDGWTPVYSQQWVLVGQTETLISSTQEQVAGKGGVINNYETTYLTSGGDVLTGDPRTLS